MDAAHGYIAADIGALGARQSHRERDWRLPPTPPDSLTHRQSHPLVVLTLCCWKATATAATVAAAAEDVDDEAYAPADHRTREREREREQP